MKCYCKTEHVCFSVSAVGDIVYNYLQMGSEQRWVDLEHFVSCLTPGNQHHRQKPTWQPYRQGDCPRWTKTEPFFSSYSLVSESYCKCMQITT